MWKIKQIFDGDYGCEELAEGQTPRKVTLANAPLIHSLLRNSLKLMVMIPTGCW